MDLVYTVLFLLVATRTAKSEDNATSSAEITELTGTELSSDSSNALTTEVAETSSMECGIQCQVDKNRTKVMLTVKDFQTYAEQNMDLLAKDYVNQAAGYMVTMKDNIEAFTRYSIRPRMLRDVSQVDLSVSVLGRRISFPVGVSPSAFHKLANPQGEVGTAQGAAELGTVITLSSMATSSLEDVARGSPGGLHWMQTYLYPSRNMTMHIVRQAEKNGYRAIVVTIDSPVSGRKLAVARDLLTQLPGHPFPHTNLSLPNLKESENSPLITIKDMFENSVHLMEDTLTWDDLKWLKRQTFLPIVAKGILTGDDAVRAMQTGASAVWVSNQGGRQLDDGPATLDVLQEVVNAVQGQVEVYVDGGFRKGTDVFKALAMGANCAFIGRPAIWGLSHSGRIGVARVLELLKEELTTAMMLSGVARISDITPSYVVRKNYYWNLWTPQL